MTRNTLWVLLAAAVLGPASSHAASASTRKYVVLANGEQVGTFDVSTAGKKVEIDWRIDNNGRGPKIKEHIELGPSGIPVRWDIEGTGPIGAPVKESFSVENGTARWKTLDDEGESNAQKSPVYVPNNGSPWSLGLDLRVLLASPDRRKSALPAGELRAEKIRQVILKRASRN
jgi:hypothetical protein